MSEAIESRLLRAARRILRPIIRILLRNGIGTLVFQELVRKEYVDVAFDEFGLPGKNQTTSRVAVLTGLNRKEVARLRGLAPLDTTDQVGRNRAASVLSTWIIDPEFLDSKGDPVALPFDGDTPNFSQLVQKQTGDVQPRAIADELVRNGALQQIDGVLHMTQRGYVPKDNPSALIDMLGTDSAELIETIDHNLQNTEDPFLQAKVLAENLPEDQVAEFLDYSKRLSRNLLEDLTHWLAARDQGDDYSGKTRRIEAGLGLYHIIREVHVVPDVEVVSRELEK